MPYLVGKAENKFESKMGEGRATPSKQLHSTITAVKAYLVEPTSARVRDVRFCWEGWRTQQASEFRQKGAAIQEAFEAELKVEYKMRGIKVDADPEPPTPVFFADAPKTAINGWTTNAKRGAKVGLTAATIGVSVAQTATGQGLLSIGEGLALGTGVAVSATGIGLIAAGLALTVGTSILSATAAWKSADHRDKLLEIYQNRDKSPLNDEKFCQVLLAGSAAKTRDAYTQHDMIANHVLPYVIFQKDTKFKRRTFGAVPIIGSLESARGAINFLYKYAKGTQGALRRNAARWLANHLISCNCLLVQAIVSELYSPSDMEWLKTQQYETVIANIERKLKST